MKWNTRTTQKFVHGNPSAGVQTLTTYKMRRLWRRVRERRVSGNGGMSIMAMNRVSCFSVAMPTLHHRERLTRNRIFGSQASIQRSLQQIPPWCYASMPAHSLQSLSMDSRIDNLLVSWSASMLRFHHEVANLLTCHICTASYHSADSMTL